MSNKICLFTIIIFVLTSEIYGIEKCGYISAVNDTYSIVYLKKPLPKDNDCGNDINFKYVYEGPATLWFIQNKDPFLYINISDEESTKCYFLVLKEHKMKSCYVNNFWKITERLIVFTTHNPSKEAFVGDVKKHMKYGCTNQEKTEAFFTQCVHHRVLPVNEYCAHIKFFYEEEKIQYQLHAIAGQKDTKSVYTKWLILNAVIIVINMFS